MHILCYIYLQVHFFSLRNYFCHLPEISPQLNVSSRYLIIFETNQILRALFTAPKMADLVTLTEEILNGKLHFLCSDCNQINLNIVIFYVEVILQEKPAKVVHCCKTLDE